MIDGANKPTHLSLWWRLLLVILGGLMNWLSFAGTDIWPLNFISYVPLMLALAPAFGPLRARALLGLGFVHGFVKYAGGYYWLATTLERFSGLPIWASALVASIFYAYLGLQHALLAFLYRRTVDILQTTHLRNWATTIAIVAGGVVVESFYPQLFDVYIATGLHSVPLLIQSADLGGPALITALLCLSSAGVYAMITARIQHRPFPRRIVLIAAGLWIANIAYGGLRISQIDAEIANAESKKIAAIQVNMGTFEKHTDISLGHRRHLEQSAAMESAHPDLDLIVWPESAFTRFIPKSLQNGLGIVGKRDAPVLLGTLSYDDEENIYNTGLLVGTDGDVLGMYDKVKLLAFAEYLPLSETFPILRDISPRSGRFSHGKRYAPLELADGTKLAVLICYEDIPPSYSRAVVKNYHADLLINITNDSWFGDTTEPWIHLALAKFRSIENRRSLVRATNSGVSVIVDPLGRQLATSKVFERDDIIANAPILKRRTLFTNLGDWPGWFALLTLIAIVIERLRRKHSAERRPV